MPGANASPALTRVTRPLSSYRAFYLFFCEQRCDRGNMITVSPRTSLQCLNTVLNNLEAEAAEEVASLATCKT